MSSHTANQHHPDIDSRDEYPQVTQADLDRATFRVGLQLAPDEDEMNEVAIPYEVGLLEDLADSEEAIAYLEAALEDGDQAIIQLALRHVIEAQKAGDDAIGIAVMDEEQLQLSTSDQFWRLISERRKQPTISRAELERRLEARDAMLQTLKSTMTPAIAEPKADYTTNDE